jgi:prephenate dehydrogenase
VTSDGHPAAGLGGLLHSCRPRRHLTASNSDNARAAATQTCARAADSNQQAVGAAEVVVLAVQYPTLDAVLAEAGDAIDGKVLIDATNRVDPAASWTAPRPPSRFRVVVAGGLLATAREVAGKLLGNRTIGQPVTVPRWRERRADLR